MAMKVPTGGDPLGSTITARPARRALRTLLTLTGHTHLPLCARSPGAMWPRASIQPEMPCCSPACQNVVMRTSAQSSRSPGSSGSILSIASSGSILSIGSAGSILSIGSAGSILSVGSVGSFASAFSIASAASAGSILSALSRWSILAWRSCGHAPLPRRRR
jgi:hypothetical protein